MARNLDFDVPVRKCNQLCALLDSAHAKLKELDGAMAGVVNRIATLKQEVAQSNSALWVPPKQVSEQQFRESLLGMLSKRGQAMLATCKELGSAAKKRRRDDLRALEEELQ